MGDNPAAKLQQLLRRHLVFGIIVVGANHMPVELLAGPVVQAARCNHRVVNGDAVFLHVAAISGSQAGGLVSILQVLLISPLP